jgi:hypothetical protein
MTGSRENKKDEARARYRLQEHALMTYFLQLDSTSYL